MVQEMLGRLLHVWEDFRSRQAGRDRVLLVFFLRQGSLVS